MDSDPKQTPPRTLVLIGFMGTGKSTIGRKLHQQIGYQFIDTDHLIEDYCGKSIPQIFADEGEQRFRDLESTVLEELAAAPAANRIISTGGGIVLRESNRKLLRELGFVVWLKAPAKDILSRTSANHHRPLLQTENPEAAIREMMAMRKPFYQETAHLKLDTAELDVEETCAGIIECASYHFNQQS